MNELQKKFVEYLSWFQESSVECCMAEHRSNDEDI